MKFILATALLLAGSLAFADQQQEISRCEKSNICGSYHGKMNLIRYFGNGYNTIEVYETVFLQRSPNNNEILATFAVTYKNGDQEKHEFTMRYTNEEHFEMISGENVVGNGQCRFNTCFYDRVTNVEGVTAIGKIEFGPLQSYLNRYEESFNADGNKVGEVLGQLERDFWSRTN